MSNKSVMKPSLEFVHEGVQEDQEQEIATSIVTDLIPKDDAVAILEPLSIRRELTDSCIFAIKKSMNQIKAINQKYAEFKLPVVTDATYEEKLKGADTDRKALVKLGTAAKDDHAELKRPALEFGNELDAALREVNAELDPAKEVMNTICKEGETALATHKQQLLAKRMKALADNGFINVKGFFANGANTIALKDIATEPQESFDALIEAGKKLVEIELEKQKVLDDKLEHLQSLITKIEEREAKMLEREAALDAREKALTQDAEPEQETPAAPLQTIASATPPETGTAHAPRPFIGGMTGERPSAPRPVTNPIIGNNIEGEDLTPETVHFPSYQKGFKDMQEMAVTALENKEGLYKTASEALRYVKGIVPDLPF